MKRMTPHEALGYLGIQHDGGLSPCPEVPNSVCSYFPKDKMHFLEPLRFEGPSESAKERLLAIGQSLSHMKLITNDGPYLHFEIHAPILRLIDDVEFLIDEESQLVHFRSASRSGYWDFGANRRRMKKVKQLFASIQV